LTPTQEKAVSRFCYEQWEMGIAVTPSIIYAAICNLRQQEKASSPSWVWFREWLKKTPSLHTIKSKPIARARIATHTEADLKNFFTQYQSTLDKYGIGRAKYIYNMDESGVRVGCPKDEIVIVPADIKELYTSSPENRKSLTIIEVICADGTSPPPPLIICPGEKIMENWVHENLTGAEVISVSPTRYTNERITLSWLDHFIKHVGAGPDKHWRMLLLDGHSTHRQDDFVIKCHENHIVPFEFPSHLTHVLQPLDIRVFRPWKHHHNKAIHHALHSLDLEYTITSFFRDLDSIRTETFKQHTIRNAFKESGMFPVAYKHALKKMRYYNNKIQSISGLDPNITGNVLNSSMEGLDEVSLGMDEEILVGLVKLPDNYYESQLGMHEWVEQAEEFSTEDKRRFE